jgi:hypothetical protein
MAVGMIIPLLLAFLYFLAFNYKIERLTQAYSNQNHQIESLKKINSINTNIDELFSNNDSTSMISKKFQIGRLQQERKNIFDEDQYEYQKAETINQAHQELSAIEDELLIGYEPSIEESRKKASISLQHILNNSVTYYSDKANKFQSFFGEAKKLNIVFLICSIVGSMMYWFVFLAFASRLKRKEDHLNSFAKKKEDFFHEVFKTIPCGIITTNKEGQFNYWNKYALDILPQGAITNSPDTWPEIYQFYSDPFMTSL